MDLNGSTMTPAADASDDFLTARKCVAPMQYFQELFISYQRSSVPIFTLVDLKSVISELIKDSAPRLTGPESGHVGCQVNSRRLENTQLLMMFEDLYLILEWCGLLNKKYRGQYGHWTKGISNPGVTQLLRFFQARFEICSTSTPTERLPLSPGMVFTTCHERVPHCLRAFERHHNNQPMWRLRTVPRLIKSTVIMFRPIMTRSITKERVSSSTATVRARQRWAADTLNKVTLQKLHNYRGTPLFAGV